eukprot:4169358-Prymnesium_polylepis.1
MCTSRSDPREKGVPRCELCDGPAYSRYFDKLEASCHDCGDMTLRTVIPVCVIVILIVLAALTGSVVTRRLKKFQHLQPMAPMGSLGAGCVAGGGDAIQGQGAGGLLPVHRRRAECTRAYNVQPPIGLEECTRWIHLLELPSKFERIFLVPTGNYRTRIWVGSSWPLVVIVTCAACLVLAEFVKGRTRRGNGSLVLRQSARALTWCCPARRQGSSGPSARRLSMMPLGGST